MSRDVYHIHFFSYSSGFQYYHHCFQLFKYECWIIQIIPLPASTSKDMTWHGSSNYATNWYAQPTSISITVSLWYAARVLAAEHRLGQAAGGNQQTSRTCTGGRPRGFVAASAEPYVATEIDRWDAGCTSRNWGFCTGLQPSFTPVLQPVQSIRD
jgi:hypothetical protein